MPNAARALTATASTALQQFLLLVLYKYRLLAVWRVKTPQVIMMMMMMVMMMILLMMMVMVMTAKFRRILLRQFFFVST